MARGPRLTGRPLNPEEYGYVIGGPVRAVEVAIAALLERGVLRISREGELSATGQPHGLSRLEAEVIEALGRNTMAVPKVIRTVSDGVAVGGIADAVRERGLGRRRRGVSLRRPTPPSRRLLNDRLAGAGLLPLGMTAAAIPLVIATDGLGAYPDQEIASALLLARASTVAGGCSYADPGSGPAGYGPDNVPYVGCSSTSGGFFTTGCGGGSSCGGSSGCGGGGCGGGS